MRLTLLFACSTAIAAGCYSPDLGTAASQGYFCHPDDKPACPDGNVCVAVPGSHPPFRCQRPRAIVPADMAGGLIPKTGVYTGVHSDSALNILADCPDESLEPNDTPNTALDAPAPTPDLPTAKITKLSICPKGPRPETGNHDVDYFRVTTTGFSQPMLSLKVDVFYDITYGDLDVGIFDQNGVLLASDGSAVSNACATTSVPPGVYYAVVAGANSVDTNRYDIRIRGYSTPQQCPAASPPDLGF